MLIILQMCAKPFKTFKYKSNSEKHFCRQFFINKQEMVGDFH